VRYKAGILRRHIGVEGAQIGKQRNASAASKKHFEGGLPRGFEISCQLASAVLADLASARPPPGCWLREKQREKGCSRRENTQFAKYVDFCGEITSFRVKTDGLPKSVRTKSCSTMKKTGIGKRKETVFLNRSTYAQQTKGRRDMRKPAR